MTTLTPGSAGGEHRRRGRLPHGDRASTLARTRVPTMDERGPPPMRTRALVAAAVLAAFAGNASAGRGWIEDPTGRTALQVAFRETPSYEDLAEAQAALTRM